MDGGVAIIQYADDTMFMFEDNLEIPIVCLIYFEQLTGLQINFRRSEGLSLERLSIRRTCTHTFLLVKKETSLLDTWGSPCIEHNLRNNDWKDTEDKIENKNSCWKANHTLI
jgi:hypothetical protein